MFEGFSQYEFFGLGILLELGSCKPDLDTLKDMLNGIGTTFASSLDINQQCGRAKKELNLREVPQLPTIRPRSLDTAQPCLIIVLAANTGDVVLPLGEHMLIEMLIDNVFHMMREQKKQVELFNLKQIDISKCDFSG